MVSPIDFRQCESQTRNLGILIGGLICIFFICFAPFEMYKILQMFGLLRNLQAITCKRLECVVSILPWFSPVVWVLCTFLSSIFFLDIARVSRKVANHELQNLKTLRIVNPVFYSFFGRKFRSQLSTLVGSGIEYGRRISNGFATG